MLHINAFNVAVALLNSTLGLDDLSSEVHGRIGTALALLDRADGEDTFEALSSAYEFMGRDADELDALLAECEERHDG